MVEAERKRCGGLKMWRGHGGEHGNGRGAVGGSSVMAAGR